MLDHTQSVFEQIALQRGRCAGRLLPAQKKHAVDFAMALADGDAVIEFGEGDKAKEGVKIVKVG